MFGWNLKDAGLSPAWCYSFPCIRLLPREFIIYFISKSNQNEKYPCLEDSDKRKYLRDREILDKYIDLNKSCLTESEKTGVRDMIYKYKDAFSLRDRDWDMPQHRN